MDSRKETRLMANFVTCVYPLSGMYNAAARYTYYTGLLLLLIGPAKPWIAVAPAMNAMIYSSTAALHSMIMVSQPRSRSAPFEVDALYAIMINILGIGPALYISLLSDAMVVRQIRVAAFSWMIWLVIGLISADLAAVRPLPVFDTCAAIDSGALLAQPRDLELANFTCVYPCFEPSLTSNIRNTLEVNAIQSLNLTSLFVSGQYKLAFVDSLYFVSLGLFGALLVSLHLSRWETMTLKPEMRVMYGAAPLALGLILSVLALEPQLRVPNFPQGELFRDADQWSVLINAVMVVSGAFYTGWKPRIRIPGMQCASHWHIADATKKPLREGSILSDMALGTNQGFRAGQNDVEALIAGLPAERLLKGRSHTSSHGQAQLNTEAPEMMPYTDIPPVESEAEKIARLLSESGFL